MGIHTRKIIKIFSHQKKTQPKLNGSINTICETIKSAVASVSECEMLSAFENGQHATVTRRAPIEMDHLQPLTPMQVDNTTESSFANGMLKEKSAKSIDMKYHWLKYRQEQKEFQFYWKLGKNNLADPLTKHQ